MAIMDLNQTTTKVINPELSLEFMGGIASKAHTICINLLGAKFCRGNMNIYLHFMSFPHIDMTQVVEIFPQVRQGHSYST